MPFKTGLYCLFLRLKSKRLTVIAMVGDPGPISYPRTLTAALWSKVNGQYYMTTFNDHMTNEGGERKFLEACV